MVPSAFMVLEALPLTPNGKLDRRALPVPVETTAGPGQPSRPEQDDADLRTRIGHLIAGILRIDTIDAEANLLNLGATSIDMIRIVNLLDREMGFRPKMDELYRDPTVAALTRTYEQHLLRTQPARSHATGTSAPSAMEKTARLLEKVKQLSKTEVEALLQASRGSNGGKA
jgi:acyl carrier protein